NPFGILYNPISICSGLSWIASGKEFTKNDLIRHNGFWHSWYHHGSYSHPDGKQCLARINDKLHETKQFFSECNYLIITYGTAYVFEHIASGLIVSNCHKIPSNQFKRHRLSIRDIENNIWNTITLAKSTSPSIKIIFSISPIRHLKDGMAENQLSKSALIVALHNVIKDNDSCFYFPAYEIMMDDLRDYRFYETDLTHPNQMAVDYIWEIFSASWLSEKCKLIIEDISRLNKARAHKSLFPGSNKQKEFIQKQLHIVDKLKKKYPHIDFSKDIDYFKNAITEN
ncbi:MAG: GSCFA domain-containing protein, partial [Calditrichaceae bacterium]|nr:GSCFA domain-containing protein [Calditrichaceae bacterium]